MRGATFSAVRNAPVDSQMYSAPSFENGISDGSRVCDVGTSTPSIFMPSSVGSIVPGQRPWIESYLNWYAMYSFDAPELTSLRSIASDFLIMRATRRPMQPKPLMPPATGETAKTAGCHPPEGNKLSGSHLCESSANWRDLRYSSNEGACEIDWRLSVSLTNGSGSRVSAMPPAPSLASSPPE